MEFEFHSGIGRFRRRRMAARPARTLRPAAWVERLEGRALLSTAITALPIPPAGSIGPLTLGADGNLWYGRTESSGGILNLPVSGRVGRMTPTGAVTEYPLPSGGYPVSRLTAGPDGNLWFTYDNGGGEYGPIGKAAPSTIGRITPTGDVTVFRTGLRPRSRPQEIVPGPEGNLWFVDAGTAHTMPEVGRITPQGAITEFPTGVQSPLGLGGIAADPAGGVWFTQVFDLPHGDEESGGVLGRIDPSGALTSFGEAPGAFGAPVAAPDGNIWFVDESTHTTTIDRVTPGGELTKFSQGLAGIPTDLVGGPGGNLWYSAQRSIGRVTPSGQITSFSGCLTYRLPFSEASTIISGPGEELWFTSITSRELPSMEEAATLGRVTASGQITLFKAGLGLEPQWLLAGPDGRVWFSSGTEEVERITPPSAPVNTFIFNPGKVSSGGVAEVPVEVPGPGTVKLRRVVLLLPHKQTLKLPGAAALHASPSACGPTALRLKLRGTALARQRKQGTLRVKVTATFTPTGGSPNTRTEVTYLRGPRKHH
jgi:streptogramin lyase